MPLASRPTGVRGAHPPRLYAYVVDHDDGFAPNPFFGVCTLATCKPGIRAKAQVGDFVVGTGGKRRDLHGRLVYYMRVDEVLGYNEYWNDPRFQLKRPLLRSNLMRASGDNIYHRDPAGGAWLQENSYHSRPDGTAEPRNVVHDTQPDRVLVSRDFADWGGSGLRVPDGFRTYGSGPGVRDVCGRRGHLVNFAEEFVPEFVAWLRGLGVHGCVGRPREWDFRLTRRWRPA